MYGGMSAAQAFGEMRLAFLHGLFLSIVLLALACIEQEIAGILHIAEDDSAARARFETLIRRARNAARSAPEYDPVSEKRLAQVSTRCL